MAADIDQKILIRLLNKGLLDLDDLIQRGVIQESAVDQLMDDVLREEAAQTNPNLSAPTQAGPSGNPAVRPGEDFGPYQDLQLLGEGGMAQVFKAFDRELSRNVALKFLRIADPALKERLLREARAQTRIDHPNICKVYEVGELQGRPYIAMQFVEGSTLKEASPELALGEKVLLIKQISEALQEAHRVGLIHRDIKPTNVIVKHDDQRGWVPYLVDFGLARQITDPGSTFTDVIVGTPTYMSPEQAAGDMHDLDRRSDLYSLGVTAYELLCGALPYAHPVAVIQSLMSEDLVPIRKRNHSIPLDLQTIVMKCLEKEPDRRYESAKELADDLQRYLNGEPISARPASWTYRISQKAKRNKLTTSILSITVLISIFLAALLVWTLWRTRIQNRYANEFAQEVRNIETMMRGVYMAPLHDIRPELGQARSRLSKMEERTKQAGKWASAPGNNALGQGYLAVGDYQKSQVYLEKAWQAGYQDSSTAYALGQVLGRLYQKGLSEAERIENKELRETKKREIEKRYRDQAVNFLKLARGHVESLAYVEGLIDFYEKRYPEALKKAQQAYNEAPWSYSAKKLEADVYKVRGWDDFRNGKSDSASAQFEKAGQAYAEAAAMARSGQEIYLGDCEREINMMSVQADQGVSPQSSLQAAISLCDKAISINPDQSDGYRNKSMAYYRLGEYQIYNTGEDPHGAFKKSIELAQQAVQRNSQFSEAFRDAGGAYQMMGEYESTQGEDPEPSMNLAIGQLQKALQINPNDAQVYNIMGNSYLGISEYRMGRGDDPRPTLEKSIQQYRKAFDMNPDLGYPHNNLGIAYLDFAEYELGHGMDPRGSLAKALGEIDKALQANPRDVYAFNNAGLAYGMIGEYELRHGDDPRPSLQMAVAKHQKALELNPNDSFAYSNISIAYLFIGEYDLKFGRDPTASLQLAIQQCKECLRINPNYSYAYNNMGLAHIAMGKYELSRSGDATTSLNEAVQQYLKALQIDSENSQAYYNMATAYTLLGVQKVDSGSDPTGPLNSARKALENAIRIDPTNYEPYRIRGELELAAARWNVRQKHPPDLFLKSSYAALEKAIQLNSTDGETYKVMAEAYLLESEWDLQHNLDTDQSIRKCQQTTEKAFSFDKNDPGIVAIQGGLSLLSAQKEAKPEVRRDLLVRARILLDKAIKMNPLLKKDYEPSLKETLSMLSHER